MTNFEKIWVFSFEVFSSIEIIKIAAKIIVFAIIIIY